MTFFRKRFNCTTPGLISWLPALGLAAMLLSACAPPTPLRIGLVGELSGGNTGIGLAGRNGALIAIEEQNARGGINGRTIELLVIDSHLEAGKALEKLAGHQAQAAIAPLVSQACAGIASEADRLGLVLICTISTAPELIGRDDMIFRLAAPVQKHAINDADFLVGALHRQRFAIAYDLRNRLYAERYAEELRRQLQTLGITAVSQFPFAALNADESATLIGKMRESGADTFVFASSPLDAARLAQDSRRLAPDTTLFGAAWSSNELPQLGGKAVEGMYVGEFYRRGDSSERFTAFQQAYQKRFKEVPTFTSVGGYDAARVLIDSLSRKSPQQTLKAALLELGPFPGLQHLIRFDRFGDNEGLSGISVIKQGEFQAIQ
jgi:branched-chain amino acid transport system substrate-binding protein